MDIDLGVGKMDGTEAAEIILHNQNIPIVFLSSHTEREVVKRTEKITSYGYVVKNSGEMVLTASIEMALRLFTVNTRLKQQEIEAVSIVDNVDGAIIRYNLNGKIIFFSRGAEKIFGYSAEEIVGTDGIGLVNPDKYRKQENENICKDGSRRWMAWSNAAVYDESGKRLYVQSIGIDRTEQKRVSEELRQSEHKFRSLVEQAAEMLFLHDTEGRILDVNLAAVKNTGYSREELLRMHVYDIDPDAEDRLDMVQFWQGLTPDDAPVRIEGRHRRKDGSVYFAEVIISKVRLADGDYMLGLARDISDRKELEEKIRYEQYLFNYLIETIPDRIYFKDLKSRFFKLNSATAAHMEISGPDEALGKTDFDFYSEEFAAETFSDERRIIATGEAIVNKEERQLLKDGTEIWMVSSKFPLLNERKEIIGTFGIGRDVTELKRTAYELQKSLKEKDNLMKELNHRVKNNLLMVTSLISLKESALEGPAE
jgi:PAS domain S-box-containing protein